LLQAPAAVQVIAHVFAAVSHDVQPAGQPSRTQ